MPPVVRGVVAASGRLEVGVGYDSNPGRKADEKGSAFAKYSASVGHSYVFAGPGVVMDLSMAGLYTAFDRMGDNFRLGAASEISRPWMNGTLIPAVSFGGVLYRDDFVPEDERNEFGTGLHLRWVATGRLELGLYRNWKWLDYRHEVVPFVTRTGGFGPGTLGQGGVLGVEGVSFFSGFTALRASGKAAEAGNARAGGLSGNGAGPYWAGGPEGNEPFCAGEEGHAPAEGASSGGPGPGVDFGQGQGGASGRPGRVEFEPVRRDDRLETLGSSVSWLPIRGITLTLAGEYARFRSSIEFEAYRQQRVGGSVAWDPSAVWHCELGMEWFETEYDAAPECEGSRADHTRHVGATISRFFGTFEAYVLFHWWDNDSPVDVEAYSETVTQCGLGWFF